MRTLWAERNGIIKRGRKKGGEGGDDSNRGVDAKLQREK